MNRLLISESTTLAKATPSQQLVSVPAARYSLTLWGQSSQPEAVRAWAFPVAFRDYASGQRITPTFENSHWRRQRYEDLHYPVPFELRFDAQLVTCMEVRAALCKAPAGSSRQSCVG